ncbi:MAG: (2Fe-2S) ferredoxin domain-containing protein [Aphanothece sp. CMT-3BRIN-NPC111]|nr:(2Fe-2S) ferredoxin domain-containing protein [Aphanothece sp. CMT-3BRIN-NPC111]
MKESPVLVTKSLSFPKLVLVCQNTACRKYGAAKVLAAFQAYPVSGVTVSGSRCLGQCGNGPMVLVMPEEIWYSRVHPDEVRAVVERHLRGDIPVAAMLYAKFHRPK